MFYHFGLKPVDNFYLMAIVLLAIYIAWFVIFNEEASAPPIIVNDTKSSGDLEKYLLIPTNKDNLRLGNIGDLVIDDFATSSMLGKSGIAQAGLAQPCSTQATGTVDPNLPISYVNQPCDTSQGLECISGIYKGSICLKAINQTCQLITDCSPESDLCINGLCQKKEEVINKPCRTDSDCQGEFEVSLNHVCDQTSKRCVFDVWPRDSGCTNKTQCKYNSIYPGSVTCDMSNGKEAVVSVDCSFIKNVEKSIYLFSINTDSLNTIRTLNTEKKDKKRENLIGLYVILFKKSGSDDKTYEGRFLITNIQDNGEQANISLDCLNFTPDSGDYILEIGTDKNGICLINFPIGTSPAVIEGSATAKYQCQAGLSLSKTTPAYCVESNRKKLGAEGQVCHALDLECQSGLSCTFDNQLVNSFTSLPNRYHTSSDGSSINGQIIKDIGRCRKQEKNIYESCNNNCIKPYICFSESDINNVNFSYCSNDWKIMEDVSTLTGCPSDNYDFAPGQDQKCLARSGKFCFEDTDCLSGKCGFNSQYYFTSYDPTENLYTQLKPMPTIKSENPPNQLTSNNIVNGIPGFISYYIKNKDHTYTLNYKIEGNKNFKTLTIKFITNPVKDPQFSVFKKSNNNYQLNISYITEYKNNRRREFNNGSSYNFINSCLSHGTSVYFPYDFTNNEVYSISFEEGYIKKVPGTGIPTSVEIIRLKAGDGTSILNPAESTMVTYSNIFSANVESDEIFSVENTNIKLHSGDFFKYKAGTSGSISYLKNDKTYSELSSGTCYYSVNFYQNPKNNLDNVNEQSRQLYFTDSYETINTNLNISTGLSFFGVSVSAPENFSTDINKNSRIEMKEMYGYHFIPIELSENGQNIKNITIKDREDYVLTQGDNPIREFNLPVGYLTDTKNIEADITENSIMLIYNYNDITNKVLSLEYSTEDSLTYFNKIDTSDGNDNHTSHYIHYDIKNSFSLPRLKVPSDNYSSTSYPYKIDQVRYFENNITSEGDNKISFLSTYKQIDTNIPETDIGNISILRKLNLTTDFTSTGTSFFKPYYNLPDLDPQPPIDISKENLPFGSASYVKLSQIKESLTSDGKGNIFLGGTDRIIFKNSKDIDVILKYGSSELVINYSIIDADGKLELYNIPINSIKSYNINSDGTEELEIKLGFFLTPNDLLSNDQTPRLFTNNIFPATFNPGTNFMQIVDGRILLSSCLPSKVSEFQTLKGGYNKILLPNKSNNNNSFYDVIITQDGYDNTSTSPPSPTGIIFWFY